MTIEELSKLADDLQLSLDEKQAALEVERAAKNALLAQKDTAITELNATIEELKNAGDPAALQVVYNKFVAIKEDLESTPVEVEEADPTEPVETTEG